MINSTADAATNASQVSILMGGGYSSINLASKKCGRLPAKATGGSPPCSKPQHRLGDDVALDLVGAAVDRDLAVVEVARRDLGGPVHGLVGAVVAVLVVGRGKRADHFHQEFGGGLLDFRTLD